jgi:hypothetical protein
MTHNIILQQFVQIHIEFFVRTVCYIGKGGSCIWNISKFLENGSSTTRVLLFMAIPGHLTFVFIIWRLATDQTRFSVLFIFLYIIAALIQVWNFSFSNRIKFISMIMIGSYSSLHCSMDSGIRLETTSRSR